MFKYLEMAITNQNCIPEDIKNRVLRRISGPNMEKVMGRWRRLHNEEIHNVFASINIIRMIKSRRMKWVWHVVDMEGMRKAYIFISQEI